jgi:hypothetical protein
MTAVLRQLQTTLLGLGKADRGSMISIHQIFSSYQETTERTLILVSLSVLFGQKRASARHIRFKAQACQHLVDGANRRGHGGNAH